MPRSPTYNMVPQTSITLPSPSFSRSDTNNLLKMVQDGDIFGPSAERWKLEKSDQRLKAKIRILRLISRFLGTALATATLSLEAHTMFTFATTHDIKHGGRGPWARQTSLWPSIMLLAASGITVFIGILTMAAYTRSIQAANKINLYETAITISIEVIHIISWIVVAVLYREGKTGHDLWGWACSPLAQKIQPNFEGIVNFSATCRRGSTNWGLGIANPAITTFNLSIWFFVVRRRRFRKMQEKLEEGDSLPERNTF